MLKYVSLQGTFLIQTTIHGLQSWTQVAGLHGKYFYPWSHLVRPTLLGLRLGPYQAVSTFSSLSYSYYKGNDKAGSKILSVSL